MEISDVINIGSSFTVVVTVITILYKLNGYKKEMIDEAIKVEKEKNKAEKVVDGRFNLIEDALTSHISENNLTTQEFRYKFEANEQRFNELKHFIEKQFQELWKRLDDYKK